MQILYMFPPSPAPLHHRQDNNKRIIVIIEFTDIYYQVFARLWRMCHFVENPFVN